jgi:hypothetical protein
MPEAGARAGALDLYIQQGTTFDLTLLWESAPGTPINLTGYVARMDIRAGEEASVPEMTLNTTNARIILGGVAGTIRLLVTDTDTAALTAGGNYVYDLELESGSGATTRVLEGKVTIDREVTRTP